MLKLHEPKKNKLRGFTLIETIVTLALLSVISLVCIGILTSALATRNDMEMKLKDQVALRQAVIAVTSDIRKNPELINTEDRFKVIGDGLLVLGYDENTDDFISSIALGIDEIQIDTASIPGSAKITIWAVQRPYADERQMVTTTIFLRT